MASIEEEVHIVSKEQERKNAKKTVKVTTKKPIEKGKIIAFSVFGIVVIIVFTLIALSFKTDEKPNNLETEIPVSEEERYNSKLEAIGESDKTKYSNDIDLEAAYKQTADDEQKRKDEEAAQNLQEQINALEEEKEQPKTIQKESLPKKQGYNNTAKSPSRTNSNSSTANYVPTEPSRKYDEPKKAGSTSSSGFFSNKSNNSSSTTSSSTNSNTLLYACIHTDQIIKDGSRVKMRLTKTTNIGSNTFPINTIVYGTARIQPNRLKVEINKINQTDVKLEIFDAEDSNSGIYVETPNLNAMVRKEFKKDALDEQDLEKIPFSKTLKNLFAKKAKEENIELLNNYKIIIKEKNEN